MADLQWGGVECRWGRRNNAILDEYLASLHTGLQCCQPYESQSVKKAATNGGKRRAHRGVRCPLFAQEDDEVFVTGSTLYVGDDGRSQTIGDSKTEFNRILCTSKSEAAVTSNKKLRCRYVEANY